MNSPARVPPARYSPGVRITEFRGEYGSVAHLFGIPADELRTRDDRGPRPRRWVARSGQDIAIAAASVTDRPDDRLFLRFAGDRGLIGPLSKHAADELRRPVYASADESELREFLAAGYELEVTTESFDVGFDEALQRLRRAWVPDGYSVISAAVADRDRLFALDNTIRNDVPGCDGWTGNRDWFDDELDESPPFDPDAYLVMVEPDGTYVGLVRMWRNSDGPRLGLVGTVRSHRRPPFAAVLLHQCLEVAALWGSSTFTTEAALSNPVTHPALVRLGAVSQGRSHQLLLRADNQPPKPDAAE